MEISNTEVYGFRSANRAMRNPLNSWDKSDSNYWPNEYLDQLENNIEARKHIECFCPEIPTDDKDALIGPNDLKLACKLIKGGGEHRKFMRQIVVWVDFTIPRYVWQELDTYKVATVRNSCSTMHKLGHQDLTPDDFQDRGVLTEVLAYLNYAGKHYREKTIANLPAEYGAQCTPHEGYDIVRWMKKHIPESFLQRSTYTCNYETLLSMYRQRKNHRLPEWSGENGICAWIAGLPYMKEFIAASER